MSASPSDQVWAHHHGAAAWAAPRAGAAARPFHASLPGYGVTPLRSVPTVAAAAGVGTCYVKDESDRMGLSAFKVLGASWAVNCALSGPGEPPASSLIELRHRIGRRRPTLVTATDGNHGRAVAWMARLLGLPARVYLPAGVGAVATERIRAEGAEVIMTGLVYDAAVQIAAGSCSDDVDLLVQDTAWPGYTEIPQRIVDGYATLFGEIDDQLDGVRADLVVVPTGVGSLLQAAVEHYRAVDRGDRPGVLAVEPVSAACVTRSLAAGTKITVDTSAPTIMAGLNCGTVSDVAWPAISIGLDAGVGVTDDQARTAMGELASAGVPAGPCGAASLAGLHAVMDHAERRSALGLGSESTVVLISTEGS